MSNDAKLRTAFATALGIEVDAITDSLEYNSIPEWDSIAHMALIAELEQTFDIMLDTDDVIDLASVAKSRQILAKYGVST